MANINSWVGTGNLTKDPELRESSGGAVCQMRIAVNGRKKDNDGSWIDKPNYVDVVAFGKQGENCAQYLAKGRPVAISGRLDWSEWETPEGQKRQAVKIVANDVQFLGGRDDAAPARQEPIAAAAAPVTTNGTPQEKYDDIPF